MDMDEVGRASASDRLLRFTSKYTLFLCNALLLTKRIFKTPDVHFILKQKVCFPRRWKDVFH